MGTTSSKRRAVGSVAILFAMILGAGGFAPTEAQSTSYLLQMPTLPIAPGDSFALAVEGDWVASVSGFQLSIAYDQFAPITNVDINVENSLVGALEPAFIQFNSDPGEIVGGVLFELVPPFQGIVLPSVGFPLLLAEITGDTAPEVEEQLVPFTFVDGLGSPPINNSFVVDFESILPETLTSGAVDIRHPPGGPDALFVRGDVNSDTFCDLGDAIFHLSYTFGNGALPVCLDAGDANDDGHSDVSDAIFILYYIFIEGPTMNPPFPNPGVDPTPDSIGCEQGLEV